ncbi:MAG TPA: hypothetical protein VGV38_01805 [Pyrinomonadaceae bacterium]|nr:hypothetical protein [Pyrinomonadaceae bacterium]
MTRATFCTGSMSKANSRPNGVLTPCSGGEKGPVPMAVAAPVSTLTR